MGSLGDRGSLPSMPRDGEANSRPHFLEFLIERRSEFDRAALVHGSQYLDPLGSLRLQNHEGGLVLIPSKLVAFNDLERFDIDKLDMAAIP